MGVETEQPKSLVSPRRNFPEYPALTTPGRPQKTLTLNTPRAKYPLHSQETLRMRKLIHQSALIALVLGLPASAVVLALLAPEPRPLPEKR